MESSIKDVRIKRVRRMALNNIFKQNTETRPGYIPAISSAFSWMYSKEGANFWIEMSFVDLSSKKKLFSLKNGIKKKRLIPLDIVKKKSIIKPFNNKKP